MKDVSGQSQEIGQLTKAHGDKLQDVKEEAEIDCVWVIKMI